MSQIKFTVIDYDQYEDEVKFRIGFVNDIVASSLEFYGYSDTFKVFADSLLLFPKLITDTILFQVGEDDKKWAYYMLLKVFCYERNGHTAIQIILDNHQQSPDTIKTEFYIKTVPASINNLGKLLFHWDPKIEKELIWNC
jgi:hypothetical protein